MEQESSSKTGSAPEQAPDAAPWAPFEPAGPVEGNHHAAPQAPLPAGELPPDAGRAEPVAVAAPEPRVEPRPFPHGEPSAGAEETAPPEPAPLAAEPTAETGPNWMLAFVCAWAGGFSLYQAWDVLRRTDLTPALHTLALAGYGSLGIGLLVAALEALLWGRLRRRGGLQLLLLSLIGVLVLAGVICLLLFKDPDPSRTKI